MGLFQKKLKQPCICTEEYKKTFISCCKRNYITKSQKIPPSLKRLAEKEKEKANNGKNTDVGHARPHTECYIKVSLISLSLGCSQAVRSR